MAARIVCRVRPSVLARVTAAMAGCAVALCSCSTTPVTKPSDDGYSANWVQFVELLLEETVASDVDPAQSELLRSHAETGEPITFEEYKQAIMGVIECAKSQGVWIDGPREEQLQGQVVIRYGFGGADESAAEKNAVLHDQCYERLGALVALAYENSASAAAWVDQQFDAYAPQLIACIRGYGGEIGDDPSRDELKQALDRLQDSAPDYSGPDCEEETGLADLIYRL